MKKILKIVLGVFVFLVLVGLFIPKNSDVVDVPTNAEGEKVTITLEEFQQIKPGMTKEEVFKIIGGEGELAAQSATDLPSGAKMIIEIYNFYGDDNSSLGANANFTFQDNKLEMKAQVGLK